MATEEQRRIVAKMQQDYADEWQHAIDAQTEIKKRYGVLAEQLTTDAEQGIAEIQKLALPDNVKAAHIDRILETTATAIKRAQVDMSKEMRELYDSPAPAKGFVNAPSQKATAGASPIPNFFSDERTGA